LVPEKANISKSPFVKVFIITATVLLVLLQETGADTCSIRVHGVVPDDSASWRCRLRYSTPSQVQNLLKNSNVFQNGKT
jgi:hypothetical protein